MGRWKLTMTTERLQRITEVAKAVGLNPRTVRYYEKRGLLRARRSSSGYRVFQEGDVRQLKLIRQLRKLDFSILETKQVLPFLLDRQSKSRRTKALKEVLTRRLAMVAEHLRELSSIHRELKDKVKRLSLKQDPAKRACCEPFCGPETCQPSLVQISGVTPPTRKGGER